LGGFSGLLFSAVLNPRHCGLLICQSPRLIAAVKAVQLLAHGSPGKFELRDVPDPRPGANEVVVEVQSAGLNRLDLWLEQGALPIQVVLPRTPGGEVAGRIVDIGSAVTGWSHGDRVAVQSNLFCGECEFCRRGDDSQCLRGLLLGVNCDGGFAEKVLVPARSLVR
jgi:D-arabinose 1-dehydrogenase-like Zn-dependent alcohol dehydrogenase